jgi:hypothetical protein
MPSKIENWNESQPIPILTVAELKRYFKAFPDKRFKRSDCEGCPIATFLAAKTGKEVDVTDENITIYLDTGNPEEGNYGTTSLDYCTPPWAAEFIAAVDAKKGGITAGAALNILNNLGKGA